MIPQPLSVPWRERWRAVLGALLGIAVVAWVSHASAATLALGSAWLVAPMGASAVLIFAVSNSPMAQPWSVVVGHSVAAAVGLLAAHLPLPIETNAALAVAGSIAAMFALRCLHPPAGGTALLMVLTAPLPWWFVAFPVAANAVALVASGVVYHRLWGRPYPNPPEPSARPGSPSPEDQEADAVLQLYYRTLSVGREELTHLLRQTRLQGHRDLLSTLRCADIMVRQVQSVHATTTVVDAAQLLQQHRIKALPVVDAQQRLTGIVTLADVMLKSAQPTQLVGDIMTRQVRVASQDRPLIELLDLFAGQGHHHLPVVGPDARLVGILTQTDVVAALCRPH